MRIEKLSEWGASVSKYMQIRGRVRKMKNNKSPVRSRKQKQGR